MELLMKKLLPGGAFAVFAFVKDTVEGAQQLKDALLAAGDWGEATRDELDAFNAALPAIASILSGKEWIDVSGLTEEQRKEVRALAQGASA